MRIVVVVAVVAALACSVSVNAYAGENLWYSVFVPGWGQVRAGHYGRGALFLSAELVSLSALGVTDLQYHRTVEQYDRARAAYLGAQYIGDAVESYDLMRQKWDDADGLYHYRTAATVAAIGVWAVNVVDMILFDEHGGPPLSMELGPGGFRVVGSVSF
jgi:Family of unknown function (DUF5683)